MILRIKNLMCLIKLKLLSDLVNPAIFNAADRYNNFFGEKV